MENWEHILEVVRLIVSSFTVSARILRKISYRQYKEYVSAKLSTKNSAEKWAVSDRGYGLHCSWYKTSQMKLNRRRNETLWTFKNVISKLRLVYFHCFFASELPRLLKEKTVFVFVVGHAYTRWRDFLSFVNDFQQILKNPKFISPN